MVDGKQSTHVKKQEQEEKEKQDKKKVDGWRELGSASGMVKGRGCD